MTSPVEALSQRIATKLVAEGLILEEDVPSVSKLLADNKSKESDWRLAIEKAIEKQRQHEQQPT